MEAEPPAGRLYIRDPAFPGDVRRTSLRSTQESLYSRPAGGSERYRKISMTDLWRYREMMKDAVPDGTGFPLVWELSTHMSSLTGWMGFFCLVRPLLFIHPFC